MGKVLFLLVWVCSHPPGLSIPVPDGVGGEVTPPSTGQNFRMSICFAAGGMPLVFTQEDCLVLCCFYRPRTKYDRGGGGLFFTGVCLSTGEGGTPLSLVPGPFVRNAPVVIYLGEGGDTPVRTPPPPPPPSGQVAPQVMQKDFLFFVYLFVCNLRT